MTSANIQGITKFGRYLTVTSNNSGGGMIKNQSMNESNNWENAIFVEDNGIYKEANENIYNTNKIVLIKPFSLYRNESLNKDS